MSTTSNPTDTDDEEHPTAEDVVAEHRPALERLAAEDTRVGDAARAFLETARMEDDHAE